MNPLEHYIDQNSPLKYLIGIYICNIIFHVYLAAVIFEFLTCFLEDITVRILVALAEPIYWMLLLHGNPTPSATDMSKQEYVSQVFPSRSSRTTTGSFARSFPLYFILYMFFIRISRIKSKG
jgi:hypothetical protein